ncbi:hypothetical protein SAMN04487949_3048 [Halogranum gelatinilyticum]|uniref:Uncharacterized protein n=1 Tax=Halogranum gelatinilyticum TaxID=660521 RepID=A0A1G9XM78_9EURY|nr:hypothetical protein [Halogranum gelatinilyticum]SDM97830.1 hypothetical protein SAMN04487949_3048 [Halogranum gelatinilyticum]
MQLPQTEQTDRAEPDDTSDDDGRRLGRYLLLGGAVVAGVAGVALARRLRARRRDREMTTIEIHDDPVVADK